VGRVALIDQGEPVILPVNHAMDGEAVVFRTARGSKLMAADNEMPVAFEVDGFDEDRRAGWSVVVRGKVTSVEEPAQLARSRRWACRLGLISPNGVTGCGSGPT